MAETKKTTAKATVKTGGSKAAEKKEAAKAAVKETAVKTAEKAAAAKEAVKSSAKKAASRKPSARTRKAATVKESVSIQFAGKDYSTEALVKIAKDVWQYDLKKDPADFKEVQLYVKPEESRVYYVINGDESGSFEI